MNNYFFSLIIPLDMNETIQREDNRLFLLELILEKKDTLFGRTSPHSAGPVTDLAKAEAWESIYLQCMSRGVSCVPPSKDWRYLRDTVWQNLRKSALKRRETGNGRAPSAVDLKVFEILGPFLHDAKPRVRHADPFASAVPVSMVPVTTTAEFAFSEDALKPTLAFSDGPFDLTTRKYDIIVCLFGLFI